VTQAQLARFRQATRGLDYAVSIANSAGLFGTVQLGCDWVRPGLALYGASPFADCSATDLTLKPVMTLASSVIAVRRVRAARASAMAAPGRHGGFPHRHHRGPATAMACTQLAEARRVLVGGERAPLAAEVSMGHAGVDVSGCARCHVGTAGGSVGTRIPGRG